MYKSKAWNVYGWKKVPYKDKEFSFKKNSHSKFCIYLPTKDSNKYKVNLLAFTICLDKNANQMIKLLANSLNDVAINYIVLEFG